MYVIYDAQNTTMAGYEGETIELTESQQNEFNETSEEIYRKVYIGVITLDNNEKITVSFEL